MSLHRADWSCYASFLLLSLMAVGFIVNTSNASTGWWAVGVSGCGKRVRSSTDCPNCATFRQNNTITPAQETKCRTEHASFLGLSVGARQAIISCQSAFNSSRWNCSTLYGDYLFGAFIATTRARETGVLNAYFTVGAIAGIAEACHEQKIIDCPCIVDAARSEDAEGNVIFEACKADFDYASNFIDEFVVSQIDQNDFGGKVDIHNIEVGKQAVNQTMETCRCHGISGTCTVQTCYKHVPAVSDVSAGLYVGYEGAIMVESDSNGDIMNSNQDRDPPTDSDIVFSELSPNFCVENILLGTVGVANRKCNPSPNKANSCNVLCCNHGHHARTKIVPHEKCEFVWCCHIACRIDRNDTITEHFCNPPPQSS